MRDRVALRVFWRPSIDLKRIAGKNCPEWPPPITRFLPFHASQDRLHRVNYIIELIEFRGRFALFASPLPPATIILFVNINYTKWPQESGRPGSGCSGTTRAIGVIVAAAIFYWKPRLPRFFAKYSRRMVKNAVIMGIWVRDLVITNAFI